MTDQHIVIHDEELKVELAILRAKLTGKKTFEEVIRQLLQRKQNI